MSRVHCTIVILITSFLFLTVINAAELRDFDMSILHVNGEPDYSLVEVLINNRIHRLKVKTNNLETSVNEWLDKVLIVENIK